ncbi:MAG: hypothetical protein AB8B69_13255 [Chitinophagales bacterium]
MFREYEYIGPKEILKRVEAKFEGKIIETSEEILDWILESSSSPKFGDSIICTFIINLAGELVIADRHSEHVQCAFGKNVRSAGEIGFLVGRKNQIDIDSITNQSTGYCPSSESWYEVEKALKRIRGLNAPEGFDPQFVFSYCPNCETRQIVKDGFYFCPKCEQPLLSEYEFQAKRKSLEFK